MISFLACESGSVSIWDIPKGGLQELIEEPSLKLKGKEKKTKKITQKKNKSILPRKNFAYMYN